MKINRQDIERFMVKVRKYQREMKPIKPTGQVLKEGLRVSKQALSQQESIALTPYGKNMLAKLDNREDRLLVSDPVTKAETYLEKQTELLLKKYCGKEKLSYDSNGSVSSYDNYSVDCWRNFKHGTDIRHAHPDMNKERQQNFLKFTKPIKDVDIIGMLKDPLFWEAVEFVASLLPEVSSSSEWKTVNLPFMTKHSNVGYPYYRNDQAVDPKTGLTYAQITDREARHLSPRDVAGYPFIAFGRNLRQKARPIMGGSRLQALVFNQLEAEEIKAYKDKSPLFYGYNDDKIQKEKFIALGKWCDLHKDHCCWNRDYVQFDTTVPPSLRTLASAIRYYKTSDQRGKDIAFWRSVSQYKAYLVNGLSDELLEILARIFSGELDTNEGGGICHAFADVYAILKQDPNWIKDTAEPVLKSNTSPIWVMGDDNLLVHLRSLIESVYRQDIHKFGMDVSQEKGEYGLFFGQRRVCLRNGEWIMITPFTRVIRQLFSKENKKGLGPAGWTVATYMNLYSLIEAPDIMVDVAKIFLPFDEFKLGTIWSVKQIKQLIAKEDKESKASQGKRAMTTAERLFDGDPLKQRFFSNDQKHIDLGPIEQVHAILSQSL